MAVQAVVELEGGSLTLTVAEVGKHVRVRGCARTRVGPSAAGVARALRGLCEELRLRPQAVHLLLGDRSVHHFVTRAPHLDEEALRDFVRREALREGSLPAGTAVWARARAVAPSAHGSGARGPYALGIVSVEPRAVQPVLDGCAEAGLAVRSLCSTESCLGAVAALAGVARAAVLDYQAGRARFVLCENGVPVQARRFQVHGVEDGDEPLMLAVQLAMEVPRTLDYMRAQGSALPSTLLVSHHLGLDAEELEQLRGAAGAVRRLEPLCEPAAGADQPSLATAGLLQLLQRRPDAVPDLLGGIHVVPVRRPLRGALLAALWGVALGSATWSVTEGRQALLMQQERTALAAERAASQRRLAAMGAAAPAGEVDPAFLARRAFLSQRRPVSRTLATVSAAVPATVRLESMRLPDRERVVLAGTAGGRDRLAALGAFSELSTALEAIPWLERSGPERIQDGAGPGELRFLLELQWRRP